MRTTFFLFAMLANVVASAQTTVQIMPVSATYTVTPSIQFKVSWTNQSTDNHRNKVWLFVDFQPVTSPTQKGNWQPATITGTVQKTAGTVSAQSNRGFFLEGTTTNFSSTVTVQLSNTGAAFNWCAYASDCPPNIGDYDNGTYTLRGTPPFTLKDANGVTQTVPDKIIAQSALTITPVTMTDATGCPGHFCKYIGRDLYVDATHKCDLRTGGAKNWEAYIRDSRDSEIYRIVLMPDNKWWFADYLDYIQTGITTIVVDGLRYYRGWPTCPAGWTVWDVTTAKSLITTYGGTNLSQVKAADTWASANRGNDYYGLRLMPTCVLKSADNTYNCNSYTHSLISGLTNDYKTGINGNSWSDSFDPWGGILKCRDYPCAPVRCFRQP